MAQESREWYKNDNYEADMPVEEVPSGRFSGDDIEFESFMFDGGQGIGVDLSRSGPLGGANGHASAVMQEPQPQPQPQNPFMGTEAPRRSDSGPLRSLRQTGPLQGATSGPLPYMQAAPPEASPFAGSTVPPQSGPLRHTGPLVDGRTSPSGPLPQSGPLNWAGAMAPGGTGPLTQRHTGPLGQGTGPLSQDGGRAQTGPLTQPGAGMGTASGTQQSRLSSLLSQRQQQSGPMGTGPLGTTGPLGVRGAGTGPLTPPSRFMQSGPLAAADVPDMASNGQPSQPFVGQAAPAPAFSAAPVAPSVPMPMPASTAWSDSSLAAVEDFSSVLLALDEAKKLTTSGSLSSGSLAGADFAPRRDSGALYSNAVPVIHDTGPHYVSADAGGYPAASTPSGGLAVDPMAWSEAAPAQSWQPAYQPTMPPAMDPQAQAQSSMEPVAGAAPQMQAQPNVSENGFSGDDLQFEPFMFDGSDAEVTPDLPYTPEFMASVTGMETAFAQPQQATSTPSTEMPSGPNRDALPFWLQNTGDLSSQSVASNMQALGDMQQAPAQQASAPASASVPVASGTEAMATTGGDEESVYSDLPPIDPFDFASLGLGEERESLGFNTEELAGYARSNYEPMTATADLQVVASILGTDPDLGTMDSEPLRPQMADMGGQLATPATSELSDEAQAGEDAQVAAQSAPTSATQQPDMQARSWTATDTSSLSMDSLESVQPATVSLDEAVSEMESEELDVAPFDFTNLNLEAQEPGTNYLDSRKARGTGPLNPRPQGTGPLQAIAASDMPYSPPEQSAQIFEEAQPVQQQPQPQVSPRRWATSWLGDSATQPTPAPTPVMEEPAYTEPAQEQEQVAYTQPEQMAHETTFDDAQSWQLQPEETPAETFGAAQTQMDQPDDEPVLSYMRDEQLRTGGLAFAGDEDEEDSESESSTVPEEYQASASSAEEYEEPIFAYAADDEPQGDALEPVATDEMSAEDYTWSARAEMVQTEPAEQDSTEYSALPSADYAAEEPEVEEEHVLVRVAPDWSESTAAQVASPTEGMETEQPASMAEATNPYTYQPMQTMQYEEQTGQQAQPVRFPTSVLASGPLPSLDGFEELQALVDRNPNDVGAHMALAAAYAQVGDVDTQLRVFRRVLRKPTVSNKILRLIAEELTDYEADLYGHPHFHQVRGDLYMKQNRYQEAIGEYNKIG